MIEKACFDCRQWMFCALEKATIDYFNGRFYLAGNNHYWYHDVSILFLAPAIVVPIGSEDGGSPPTAILNKIFSA